MLRCRRSSDEHGSESRWRQVCVVRHTAPDQGTWARERVLFVVRMRGSSLLLFAVAPLPLDQSLVPFCTRIGYTVIRYTAIGFTAIGGTRRRTPVGEGHVRCAPRHAVRVPVGHVGVGGTT